MSEGSGLVKSGFYSVELRTEHESCGLFVEAKDENVEFCELDELGAQFLPEILEDLDLVLKYFCDKAAKVDKDDAGKLEKVTLRFKEKIQEIMFNPKIFGQDLVGIVKRKFFGMHSHFDREHSAALIDLRNSLIAKCQMPMEIKKFFVKTVTIDEVNSRFQERVLMMKNNDLGEIRKAFEESYDRFIVDRSCIDEEFLEYSEVMKQARARIVEGLSQDLFDTIKDFLVQGEYQWLVIKGQYFDRHISLLPKQFDLNLTPIDAMFTLKGKYQIEQFSDVKPGICLLITSKENTYSENVSMSFLLFYHTCKRKGLNAFDGLVQIVPGSDSGNLIILHKNSNKLTKMIFVYKRFVECKVYELDPLVLKEINLITYNNVAEKIVFTTNDHKLYVVNENSSMQVLNEGNKIYWIRYLSYLNIFIMIKNDIVEVFDSEFNTIAKLYLNELGGLFPADFIENQNYEFVGLTAFKEKLWFSNLRQNFIYYYKVDIGKEIFRKSSRKSIVSAIIDVVANKVNPAFRELLQNKHGFDTIKVKSAFENYLGFIKSGNCFESKIEMNGDSEDREAA